MVQSIEWSNLWSIGAMRIYKNGNHNLVSGVLSLPLENAAEVRRRSAPTPVAGEFRLSPCDTNFSRREPHTNRSWFYGQLTRPPREPFDLVECPSWSTT
jgi:hypothetical protein